MTVAASPTQTSMMKALGDVLKVVLPDGMPIILGQANRVPEPKVDNFVVMTPTRRGRIATNLDADSDVEFTASIAGTTMTVSDMAFGTIAVGTNVFGGNVESSTTVVSFGTGTGGVGTYVVSKPQTVASETMATGSIDVTQQTEIDVQLDFHGSSSADNAQVVSTIFRDPYGVGLFEAAGDVAVPLYADDPRQMPFINSENQYEDRWIVEAAIQANPTISISQQFAGSLNVELVNVDARFPPS